MTTQSPKQPEPLEVLEALSANQTGSLEQVLALSRDPDEEVRMRAIEKCAEFPKEDVYDRCVEALGDADSLVRAEALETLAGWSDKSDLELIATCLDDPEEMVRCSAIDAIGEVGELAEVSILEQSLLKATEREMVSIYSAIRKIDPKNEQPLWSLMELLNNGDYRIRCAVANSLQSDLCFEGDLPKIESRLRGTLANEDTMAARSSIEAALTRLLGHRPCTAKG